MEKIEKTKCDYCDHQVTSFQSNLENLLCAKSKSCKICSFKIRTEKKQKNQLMEKLKNLNVTTVIIK